MGPAIFVPIFRKSDNSEENKMSGCGCSFSPAEEIKEEVKYTDALAEQFAKEVGVDPRPNETLVEIDEFNDLLFPHINNSHYRMAFCQSLEAYDEAYEDFYESLDKLDKGLETNRFLFGDYITDSDVRAYVTLARSLP